MKHCSKKYKIAFTLIETLLVIGVIMLMSIVKMRDLNNESQTIKANLLAGQIKTVASATNAFLVLKYEELSKLSSSGISCNTGNNTCSLTIKNLNDHALLPPNFSNKTILGEDYNIQLKRTGSAPNYMLSGIVITKADRGNVDPVFTGKILQAIGQDGGVNKTEGKLFGNSGGWSADSTMFPVLSGKTNYIGAAVGSLSGAYYVYLRRDGTLPMTGDLNLDSHNINNVKDLTAVGQIKTTGNILGGTISSTGTVSVGSNLTAKGTINADGEIFSANQLRTNGEIIGKNYYGDTIAIGGDAGGEDYEIRLSNGNRPLAIYSPNINDYTTVLKTYRGNVSFSQRLGLMNTDPNALPAGWHGGLTTLDVYANGTVGLGSGGGVAAYMNSGGYIYASNNVTSSGNVNAGDSLIANNNVIANNTVRSGNMETSRILLSGVAVAGTGCGRSGELINDPNNNLLVCKKGRWRNISVQNIPPQEIYCRSQLNGSVYTDHYARIDENGNISSRTVRAGYGDSGWRSGSSSVSYGITNVIATGISGRTLTYRSEQGEYVCLQSWVRD